MQLTFLGATGTVTGSRYLLEQGGQRLLLDCGLFQGVKQLRLRNWTPLPVDPASVGAVILTHAHLDHSGWLPRLVRDGFRGVTHASSPTQALCGLLLLDSAHLLEEESAYANRHGWSKHSPALPLYTQQDARAALETIQGHRFGEAFEPLPGWRVTLHRAGHLLGAASVRVEAGGRSILFSGDLGGERDLLMPGPEDPETADTVVVESTYGDRERPPGDPLDAIADVVSRTAARGGIVVVPTFAVGRAQAVAWALHQLKQRHRIPDLPVFLNSPMAAAATGLYREYCHEQLLTPAQFRDLERSIRVVQTVEESKALNGLRMPAVILSASGMASGGRVLHHLKAFAPDPRNCLLFVGFQAAGTRGAAIVAGVPSVKIHGSHVPIHAEVRRVDGLSAHADRRELLAWLGRLPGAPARVYVTHGEPAAADALRQAIEEQYRWPCVVPEHLQSVTV